MQVKLARDAAQCPYRSKTLGLFRRLGYHDDKASASAKAPSWALGIWRRREGCPGRIGGESEEEGTRQSRVSRSRVETQGR